MKIRNRKVRNTVRSVKVKARLKNLTGMIFIGLGLIFVGLTGLLLLPRKNLVAASLSPSVPRTIPVEVNYEAPSLTLSSLDGKEHSLEEYRGQVVLVNLWATWCPPCKAEMPILDTYFQEHSDEGFTLIAINDGDTKEDVITFVENYGLSFPVWIDTEHKATINAFKTQSLPSSFVLDREGVIRLRWVGEIELDILEEYVTPLLTQ
jgi:thiol-disulfide isomerase/thioredoxin